MQADGTLSPQEMAFVEAFITNGGNGTQAAIAAGYSPATARFQASRLLKRDRIRDEIERRIKEKPKGPRSTINGDILVLRPDATTNDGPGDDEPWEDIIPPGAELDVEKAKRINRDWITARLMRNMQMCMGEIERTVSVKVETRIDDKGNTTHHAIAVKTYMHDPAGAATSASLLMKELDRRDGELPDQPGASETAKLPHRAAFEERMRTFRQTVEERSAAMRPPKPNGANGNGHTNGNGAGHG